MAAAPSITIISVARYLLKNSIVATRRNSFSYRITERQNAKNISIQSSLDLSYIVAYNGLICFIRFSEMKIIEVITLAGKRVTVTQESDSGRNEKFHDNRTGQDMSRAEFVRQIEQGKYPNYHVRKIEGVKTPVSNPDRTENNNLD